jgi:hypothetical protein
VTEHAAALIARLRQRGDPIIGSTDDEPAERAREVAASDVHLAEFIRRMRIEVGALLAEGC